MAVKIPHLLPLCIVLALAGCAASRPAPVIDRGVTRAAVASEQPGTYVVRRGDTLYSIALEHGVDWHDLAAWNGISDPTRMAVGQRLRVQSADVVTPPAQSDAVQVTPIGGGPLIETRPIAGAAGPAAPIAPAAATAAAAIAASGMVKAEPQALKLPYSEQNLALVRQRDAAPVPAAPVPAAPVAGPSSGAPAAAPAPTAPAASSPPAAQPVARNGASTPGTDVSADAGGVRWSWPARGDLGAKFADGGNKGVEIAGSAGASVLAAADGKVTYVGDAVRGYGNLVIVKHNDMYLSVYAHNSKILVKEGQMVTRGQKIAEMGGAADKPQLHFEIRRYGKPIDPLQFLPGAG